MKEFSLKLEGKKKLVVIISVIVLFIGAIVIMAAETDPGCITPKNDEHFELRAVKVEEIPGQNKQVTMELWGNNIEFFKGFDVRFTYDQTKLQTSNVLTNEVTNDATQYFQLEDDFKNALEFTTIEFDAEGNGIRAELAFNDKLAEELEETDYIKPNYIKDGESVGKVVYIGGKGKSVRLRNNEFSNDGR